MIYRTNFSFSTAASQELVDITRQVERIVRESGVKNGLCHVHSGHTTSAIVVNENEPRLKEDFLSLLNYWVPKDGWKHGHNAHSHLKSLVIGNSRSLPVSGGNLDLGTWQSLFFLEMDGPRQREVLVTIIGE